MIELLRCAAKLTDEFCELLDEHPNALDGDDDDDLWLQALTHVEICNGYLEGDLGVLPALTRPLARVTRLNLFSLDLVEIPEGSLFCFLPALEKLDLRYNDLSDLPGDLAGCAQLRSVRLRRNRFTRYPAALLRCRALRTLDPPSDSAALPACPPVELGAALPRLARLALFSRAPERDFAELLRYLEAVAPRLERLTVDFAFERLDGPRRARLAAALRAAPPFELRFAHGRELAQRALLPLLPPSTLLGLALRVPVSGDTAAEFPDAGAEAFPRLPALRRLSAVFPPGRDSAPWGAALPLDAAAERLALEKRGAETAAFALPDGALPARPALRRLRLVQCRLARGGVPAALPALEELRLLRCGLPPLPTSAFEAPLLAKVSLRGCEIAALPPALLALPALRALDLSHCKGIGKALRRGGAVGAEPTWAARCPSLRKLDLSSCHLARMPPWLACFPGLRRLRLSVNPLWGLGEACGDALERGTPGLMLLDLSMTKAPSFAPLFRGRRFSQLRDLDISYCDQLEEWPCLRGCPRLRAFLAHGMVSFNDRTGPPPLVPALVFAPECRLRLLSASSVALDLAGCVDLGDGEDDAGSAPETAADERRRTRLKLCFDALRKAAPGPHWSEDAIAAAFPAPRARFPPSLRALRALSFFSGQCPTFFEVVLLLYVLPELRCFHQGARYGRHTEHPDVGDLEFAERSFLLFRGAPACAPHLRQLHLYLPAPEVVQCKLLLPWLEGLTSLGVFVSDDVSAEDEGELAAADRRLRRRCALFCPPLPSLSTVRRLELEGGSTLLRNLAGQLPLLPRVLWLLLHRVGLPRGLPAELGRCRRLVYLSVSADSDPPEIAGDPAGRDVVLGTYFPMRSWLGGLTGLHELDLSGHPVRNLPGAVGGLTRLETLDLRGSALTDLPPELARCTALVSLDLSENPIFSLPKCLLRLPNLTSLDLRSCRLRRLRAPRWQPSSGSPQRPWATLERLVLCSNRLASASLATLLPTTRLPALEDLDLSYNSLWLDRDGGGGDEGGGSLALPSLERLNLHHNHLRGVPLALLAAAPRLTSIVLRHNQLAALPPGLARWVPPTLDDMDLRANRLTDLGGWLPPPGMRDLSLKKNTQLLSLQPAPPLLAARAPGVELFMRELCLDAIGLTAVPACLASMPHLRDLRLNGNPLQRLDFAGLRLPALRSLEVARCTPALADLDNWGDLAPLAPKLESLDASETLLTALPPALLILTRLEDLDLSGNALTALPAGMAALTRLRSLSLQGNALTGLPAALGALPRLTRLNLEVNAPLRRLPLALALLEGGTVDVSGTRCDTECWAPPRGSGDNGDAENAENPGVERRLRAAGLSRPAVSRALARAGAPEELAAARRRRFEMVADPRFAVRLAAPAHAERAEAEAEDRRLPPLVRLSLTRLLRRPELLPEETAAGGLSDSDRLHVGDHPRSGVEKIVAMLPFLRSALRDVAEGGLLRTCEWCAEPYMGAALPVHLRAYLLVFWDNLRSFKVRAEVCSPGCALDLEQTLAAARTEGDPGPDYEDHLDDDSEDDMETLPEPSSDDEELLDLLRSLSPSRSGSEEEGNEDLDF